MQKKRAFTLIELLVVIAIIALLLAILIPALNTVKRQASGIVCGANMRGLSMGWYVYQDQNDGKLVDGHTPRNTNDKNRWAIAAPQNEAGVYTGDPIPCPLEDEALGIMRGLLFPFVESVDAYHCPGDRNYRKTVGRGGYRSYSITGLMNGEDTGHPNHVKKFGEIKNPANKYVWVECTDDRGWNMGSWVIFDFGVGRWTDPLAVFHNDRSTLGFADGHAEVHHWVDESTIRMSEEQIFGLQVPAGEGADLEYMERGYLPGPLK